MKKLNLENPSSDYDVESYQTNITGASQRKVVHIMHSVKNGRKSKDQIKAYINGVKDILSKKPRFKGYNVALNVFLDKTLGAWRMGKEGRMTDPINFPQARFEESDKLFDQGTFKQFDLFLIPRPAPAGGASKNNDCLFRALRKIYGDKCVFQRDTQLKLFLKVKPHEKIPLDKLEPLSEKLKASIRVSGDYTAFYKNKDHIEQIHLKLKNEHYTAGNVKPAKKYMVYSKEKPIMIVRRQKDSIIYSKGEEDREIPLNSEEYKEMDIYNNYVVVKPYDDDKRTCKEQYTQYMEDALICNEELKRTANVDLTTHSIRDVILKLLYELTPTLPEPEPVDNIEAEWIENATMGALMNAKPGFYKEAYTYDFNSHYLSIKQNGRLPYSRPEFERLDELPETIRYGIYRAKVKGTHIYFRKNPEHYYTHADLYTAKELGLLYELIQDGQANAMIYNKLLHAGKLLGDLVDILYSLKRRGVRMAKNMLNCIWGVLVQKRIIRMTTREKNADINGKTLESVKRLRDGTYYITCTNQGAKKYMIPEYARIKPFIMAHARRKLIHEGIKHGIDNVIRIHTDSLTFDKKVNIKPSKKLGRLKIEADKTGRGVIIHNKIRITKNNVFKENLII